MTKKRKQAVGHKLPPDYEELLEQLLWEGLANAETETESWIDRAARWKAVAKRWRESALTLGIAQEVLLDALESFEEIEEKADD